MHLPVYVLDKEDTVPLASGTSMMTIPLSKAHFLQPLTVINHENTEEEQVVIVLTKKGTNWVLMRDLVALENAVLPIGILCTVENREESDDFELVTLVAKHKVYTEALCMSQTIGEHPIIEVVLNVAPSFVEDEEKLALDIKNICDNITKYSNIFDSHMLDKIQSAKNLSSKMDAIANSLLKTNKDRSDYLQQEDAFDRWDMLIHAIAIAMKGHKEASAKSASSKPGRKSKRRLTTEKTAMSEKTDLKERLRRSKVPEMHRESIRKEINRLSAISKNSTEYSMLTDYLDSVLSIPWGITSYKNFDLSSLRDTLNETHHGLGDVKDHLLEHMCIERLRGGSTGTVLCFVGPPGTGKTTIAAQIAKASKRSLQRIALGGLSDEAEIRG